MTILTYLRRADLEQGGMPLAINHKWVGEYVFDAGIPIVETPDRPPAVSATVQIGATPSGRFVKAVHVGPYIEMGATYGAIKAFAAAHGFELGTPPWEQYVSDPGDTPEDELISHIFYPIVAN